MDGPGDGVECPRIHEHLRPAVGVDHREFREPDVEADACARGSRAGGRQAAAVVTPPHAHTAIPRLAPGAPRLRAAGQPAPIPRRPQSVSTTVPSSPGESVSLSLNVIPPGMSISKRWTCGGARASLQPRAQACFERLARAGSMRRAARALRCFPMRFPSRLNTRHVLYRRPSASRSGIDLPAAGGGGVPRMLDHSRTPRGQAQRGRLRRAPSDDVDPELPSRLCQHGGRRRGPAFTGARRRLSRGARRTAASPGESGGGRGRTTRCR